ncbi:MAG: hypothetical protein JWP91_555 [Fibrobacteres bacterium]|nr:hypothetical protein [Fibrobacterota bacterium]
MGRRAEGETEKPKRYFTGRTFLESGESMITGKNALTIKSNFTREDLRRMAGDGDGWRLSLYMPLHRTGREVRQAPILLKDLRTRAAAELGGRGCGPDTIAELLAPVNQVFEETDFTLLQGEGLAILSSRTFSASFLLPIAPPAAADVGRRFLLDPLLPLLFEDGRFHLLALGLHSVRLFEADRIRLREIPLDGIATNMRDALRMDEDATFTNLNSAASPRGGRSPGISHGHGGAREDLKEPRQDIQDFFRQLDRSLLMRLDGTGLPMMLAGVEYMLPIYRDVSSHPRLTAKGVRGGNTAANLDLEELHGKAWSAYRAERQEEVREILKSYRERLARPETVSGIRNTLVAASEGRVSHMFLRKGFRMWGRFDPEDQRVSIADGPGPEEENLVNLACIHALLAGGKIYGVDEGEIPERADIAALCRY